MCPWRGEFTCIQAYGCPAGFDLWCQIHLALTLGRQRSCNRSLSEARRWCQRRFLSGFRIPIKPLGGAHYLHAFVGFLKSFETVLSHQLLGLIGLCIAIFIPAIFCLKTGTGWGLSNGPRDVGAFLRLTSHGAEQKLPYSQVSRLQTYICVCVQTL